MSANEVIEAYVVEVMRRLPAGERNEIGLELRDLLTEMLADRAPATDGGASDAMVLAMLREFGTPAEIAARYRSPGGMVVIPADGTRSFALLTVGGIGLQWALTLPRVFEGQPLTAWWFTWGLGAFWWPGFMATMALVSAWLRHRGLFKPAWRPRMVDPERVNRGALAFGLLWYAIGAMLVTSLPWIGGWMPDPFPQIFAFDPVFLRERAWPVLPLWLGGFATLAAVWVEGRWSRSARRLQVGFGLGFLALLVWWLAAGDIFQAKATNDGARGALGLVVLMIVADLAYRLYRERTRIRTPRLAG